MATIYATKADCLLYTEGLTVTDDAAFDRLIGRAEKDIDSILGGWPIGTNGRKFDPAQLSTSQAQQLQDATCAQVEYRIEMGEAFFVRGQRSREKGPDFELEGKLPRIGPKVADELRSSGLVRIMTGRARA